MGTITVVTRDGIEHIIDAAEGLSIMEIVRDAGLDELQALCGGCLSCATCHVHIDAEFAGRIDPASDDEVELLDTSPRRDARSRLSCQIAYEARLEGLRLVIAEED